MTNEQEPKWFAGHTAAMGRQGLAELRAAFYPESNIAQPPGPGIFGTETQKGVDESRQADLTRGSPDSPSIFDGRLGEPDRNADAQDREPPQPERE